MFMTFHLYVPYILSIYSSVTIERKYGNRVPKAKIRWKPDSFELVYTKLSHTVKSSARVHEQLFQLKCSLFLD